MVIADIDMVVQQISLGQIWGLIFVSGCLDLTLAMLLWQVCLPFTNIGNRCQEDMKLIPNSPSGKDVNIYSTYVLSRGSEMVGPINLV